MELKKMSLQSELLDTFDHLYDRHVPQSVRYVTESLDQLNSRPKIKKPRKKGFEEDSGLDTLWKTGCKATFSPILRGFRLLGISSYPHTYPHVWGYVRPNMPQKPFAYFQAG